MIRYIKLENYKSLVNLDVDFMKNKTKAKNLALIYGENGAGKSNFASVFYTIFETMETKSRDEKLKRVLSDLDLTEKSPLYNDFINKNIRMFKDIKVIINDCKTVNSKGNMVIEFGFKIKNNDGVYKLEFSDKKIVSEKLDFVLNKNITNYFHITKENIYVNEAIILNKKLYNEILYLLEKYWGKHTLLAIITSEISDKKEGFIFDNISKGFKSVINYLYNINVRTKDGSNGEYVVSSTKYPLFTTLQTGKILKKDENKLNRIEELLNVFFTNLYADVKNVYYKKEYTETEIIYKLFFRKQIYGEIKDIDFALESTGTGNLLELLPFLMSACDGNTVIIDEFDTGMHDLLVTNILENVSKYLKGQLIITTHNTMLLESDFSRDNIYLFLVDHKGAKQLLPITEFNDRIQKNINVRKRYLSGVYQAVPSIIDVDFKELISLLK